jgi:addiction module RelE/StbE family toxin
MMPHDVRRLKKVDYAKEFLKQLQKAPSKIRIAFQNRLTLFLENPLNPILHNHVLIGRLKDYRSINVTGNWRAIYSEETNQHGEITIVFKLIGTHSQLYK